MRSIDWKRTARTGKLVAKETSRAGVIRVMVLLDLTSLGPRAAKPLDTPAPQPPRIDFLGRQINPPPPKPPDPSHPWVDAERAIGLAASIICDAYFQGYAVGLAVLGAQCPVFRVHHSLPHRDLILNALTQLDLAKPAPPNFDPIIHPTLVIRPRAAGPAGPISRSGATTLSAGDFEQHVIELDGGATALLSTPQRALTRHAGQEAASWR